MIHEIEPYKIEFEYNDICPESNDMIIVVSDDNILIITDYNNIPYPSWSDIRACVPRISDSEARFLFEIKGAGRFFLLCTCEKNIKVISQSMRFSPLSQESIQNIKPRWAAFAGTSAFQFFRWYDSNRFCGKCGAPMNHHAKSRKLVCTNCNVFVYPRINPVVIIGVTNGDKLLITKYADDENMPFELVAGFTEPCESLEDAARREVMEETGLSIKNLRFYKSQPWPISDSLIIGLFCDLDGSDKVSFNDGELSVAIWTKREDVPCYDDDQTLTSDMMIAFHNSLI